MNRIIKFRAWFEEQMLPNEEFTLENNKGIYYKTVDQGCGCCFEDETHYLTEIMQFTGLKDKNGKEIYEGDIIRISRVLDYDNFVTDVYFKDSAFRYRFSDGSGSVLPRHTKKVKGYEGVTEDIEVIGNIFENKELLEC